MAASLALQKNPYIVGPPIKDPGRFFGRRDLFKFISSTLTSGLASRAKVILLRGQRRIGKSSVLAQIPLLPDLAEFVFALIDFQYVALQPVEGVIHEMSEKITTVPALKSKGVRAPATEDLGRDIHIFSREFLTAVLGTLDGRKLVLLVDEFDVLGDERAAAVAKPLFTQLNAALQMHENLYLIAVIGRRLDDAELLQSMFHESPSREIGLLDRESAVELITKPAESALQFTPAAIDAILALTAGHPYLTQVLAHALFEHAQQRNVDTIDHDDIAAVIPRVYETGHEGFAFFRNGLPAPERVVFAALAECQEKSRNGPCTRAEIYKAMEDRGVVVNKPFSDALDRLTLWKYVSDDLQPKYYFKITVELVRRWIVRYHPLPEEIKSLESCSDKAAREKYEQSSASRDADPARTREILDEILAQNPNHFRALGDAAQLALQAGDCESAASLYKRVWAADPTGITAENYAKALTGWSRAKLAKGDAGGAVETLRKAREVDPENEEAAALLPEYEDRLRRSRAAQNPFVVGSPVPPGEFAGRKQQVGTALSAILKYSGNVAFFGERRMGKTSLLRYLASPAPWRLSGLDPRSVLPVYIDCSLSESRNASVLWKRAAAETLSKTRSMAPSQTPANPVSTPITSPGGIADSWRSLANPLAGFVARLFPIFYLEMVVASLSRRGLRLVLIFDEFDAMLGRGEPPPQQVIAEMRRLQGQSACFVLSTRRRLDSVGAAQASAESPWHNMFESVPVALFEAAEANEFIRKMPFPMTDTEVGWVDETAGRVPFLLSAALNILFRQKAEAQPFAPLEATTELSRIAESFFTQIWEAALPRERAILAMLAMRDCELRTARFSDVDYDNAVLQSAPDAERLEVRGLAVSERGPSGIRYSLPCSIASFWFARIAEQETARAALVTTVAEMLPEPSAARLQGALANLSERKLTANIEPWSREFREVPR